MLVVASLWLVSESLVLKPTVLSTLTQNSQVLLAEPEFRYLEIKQIAEGALKNSFSDEATKLAIEKYQSTQKNTDSVILILYLIVGSPDRQ